MKSLLKPSLVLALLVMLGYNSVYFEKLSERREAAEKTVDFAALADSLYYQGILKTSEPVAWADLRDELNTAPDSAFARYGNRLGIGTSAFFFVRQGGIIAEITPEAIRLEPTSEGAVEINTRYVFGNALRDASRQVTLTDFKTNAEFNSLSEALNRLIREQVLPPVLEGLQPGDSIAVTGAVKLGMRNPVPARLTITPAQIVKH